MQPINISDGQGSKRRAGVDELHRLKVVASIGREIPPPVDVGTPNYYRYFSALMGSSGADSGTTDMAVDGSGTPQEFYIQQNEDYDIYITDIIILVADGVIAHNKWGSAPLSTGFDLKVSESGADTFLLEKVKSVGQILEQVAIIDPFGSGTDLNIITNYSGTNDAFLGVIQLDEIVPYGLRLGRGGIDKITAVVNDDHTGLAEMTIRCLGYRHYPRET